MEQETEFRMVIFLELSLMGQDKLKVSLTPFDMIRYDLTCDKIDYDNTETRRAVWSILDHAKHETGFDAATGRIYIQVYPEKNGGCEIYITKLSRNELPSAGDMNSTNEKAIAPLRDVLAVYRFEDSENLLRVCKFLARRGYDARSDAFVEETARQKRRYFLLITEPAPQRVRTRYLRDNLFIGEFGVRIPSSSIIPYLREHCHCFCPEDAVHTLAQLAK